MACLVASIFLLITYGGFQWGSGLELGLTMTWYTSDWQGCVAWSFVLLEKKQSSEIVRAEGSTIYSITTLYMAWFMCHSQRQICPNSNLAEAPPDRHLSSTKQVRDTCCWEEHFCQVSLMRTVLQDREDRERTSEIEMLCEQYPGHYQHNRMNFCFICELVCCYFVHLIKIKTQNLFAISIIWKRREACYNYI